MKAIAITTLILLFTVGCNLHVGKSVTAGYYGQFQPKSQGVMVAGSSGSSGSSAEAATVDAGNDILQHRELDAAMVDSDQTGQGQSNAISAPTTQRNSQSDSDATQTPTATTTPTIEVPVTP